MPTVSTLPIDCDFDESLCGFTNSEDFPWTRNKGQTPSDETGPYSDHTTGVGYYMFVEATDPNSACSR